MPFSMLILVFWQKLAEFDNIQKIAPFLDKHLLLPLLEHAQSQNVS